MTPADFASHRLQSEQAEGLTPEVGARTGGVLPRPAGASFGVFQLTPLSRSGNTDFWLNGRFAQNRASLHDPQAVERSWAEICGPNVRKLLCKAHPALPFSHPLLVRGVA